MANGRKVTQRVSTVTYKDVDKYILELTREEARTLHRVTCKIGGKRDSSKKGWSRRAHTQRILNALISMGISTEPSEFPAHGQIEFKDCSREWNDS